MTDYRIVSTPDADRLPVGSIVFPRSDRENEPRLKTYIPSHKMSDDRNGWARGGTHGLDLYGYDEYFVLAEARKPVRVFTLGETLNEKDVAELPVGAIVLDNFEWRLTRDEKTREMRGPVIKVDTNEWAPALGATSDVTYGGRGHTYLGLDFPVTLLYLP